MLFKKRELKANAKEVLPNLALQSSGNVAKKISDVRSVKGLINKNVVPIIHKASDDRERRLEKFTALAQTKLFKNSKYRNLDEVTTECAVPIAERIASRWQAIQWIQRDVIKERDWDKRKLHPLWDIYYRADSRFPYYDTREMLSALYTLVNMYYKNISHKDIHKFIYDNFGYFKSWVEISSYGTKSCEEITDYVYKNSIENTQKLNEIYHKVLTLSLDDYEISVGDALQIVLYKYVEQNNPMASRHMNYTDMMFIHSDLKSLAYCINNAQRVLERKRNYKLTRDNVRNVIKKLSYGNYLTNNEYIKRQVDDKYNQVSVGMPSQDKNNLFEDIADEDAYKYTRDYWNNLEQKEEETADGLEAPEMILPTWLDDNTSNRILEEANENFRSNLFRSGWGDALHGKSRLRKFVPNRRDKVAEMKLHKQSSDVGVKPSRVHRIITDKKVFTRRKKVAGGSMLIDCSGSMGWSDEEVREIVRILPASSIAGYVGYSTEREGYNGDIRIIAKEGKYDDNAIPLLNQYGANNIDLEAIEWLSKQDEPRVWVTDQQVVGVDKNGNPTSGMPSKRRADIIRLMKRYNIIPIESYDLVKEFATQYASHVG